MKRNKASGNSFAPVVAFSCVCTAFAVVFAVMAFRGLLSTVGALRSEGNPIPMSLWMSAILGFLIDTGIVIGALGLLRRSERSRHLLVGSLLAHGILLIVSGGCMARAMEMLTINYASDAALQFQENDRFIGAFFIVGVFPLLVLDAVLIVVATRKFVTRQMTGDSRGTQSQLSL